MEKTNLTNRKSPEEQFERRLREAFHQHREKLGPGQVRVADSLGISPAGSMSMLWTKKVERLCCFFKFLILLLLWCNDSQNPSP